MLDLISKPQKSTVRWIIYTLAVVGGVVGGGRDAHLSVTEYKSAPEYPPALAQGYMSPATLRLRTPEQREKRSHRRLQHPGMF